MIENKKWYHDTGSHGDCVLATRVQLMRNFAGIPFPAALTGDAVRQVNHSVLTAVEGFRDFSFFAVHMDSLPAYEAVALAERKLISADFAAARENRLLLLSKDESISVMVNERDHLRMQVLLGGLCTEKAYDCLNRLDDAFDSVFTYAFDEKLGYLTQNPTNLGTAMRASVILHLPVLSAQGVMLSFASTAGKLGLSVRSLFGEGGSAKGDLYLLTNTVTMGLTEQAALQNLKAFALQLETRERVAAEQYVTDPDVADRMQQALYTLLHAKHLPTDEMLENLSLVRLGAVYGIVGIPVETLNELFVCMQPACINCLAGMHLNKLDRDLVRAQIVREKLK